MNEDDVRNALSAQVKNLHPNRDRLRRAQVNAAHRRRRRDTAKAAVLSSAASILVVVGVLSSGIVGDFGPTKTNGTDQAPTAIDLAARIESTSPDPDAATATAATDRKGVLVAASAAGRLVQLDPIKGTTVKVLATVNNPQKRGTGGLVGHVAVDTAGNRVFYDVITADTCDAEIHSVKLDGSGVVTIGAGSAPAVSPDGSRLAYTQNGTCGGAPRIVIRDLKTSAERVAVTAKTIGTDAPATVQQLSWSPDGSSLLADIRYEQSDLNHLAVFDAAATASIAEGRILRPEGKNIAWEWASYLPDGRLFLSERCCTSDAQEVSNETSRMVVVDPNAPGATLIAYGVVTKSHTATSSDTTGRHLVYLSGQDLLVSDNSARPLPLAFGLIGVDWR